MNNVINEYARSKGIIYGICDAKTLEGLDESIVNIPFFKGDIYERISPRIFLHGAKSVIVLGVKADQTPLFEGLDQIMAPSLSGVDYHKHLEGIAKELTSKMLECADFNFRIQVDSGPLIEKKFAAKAGLGFIGKNNCLISPEFGSFFNIALIVVDIEIELTCSSGFLSCEDCDLCLISCPTGALGQNNKFNYNRCISYLTQKRDDLTEDEMALIGLSIYGCDICQNICPHNSHTPSQNQKEVSEKVLREILNMDSKQFEEKFKNSNLFWRGNGVIKRNCRIVLDNLEKL
ncbi:MAG: hypothetical protein FWE24_11120 [Defluviitaleaceae bacterium]|nr:hypothetical protein [Defluviitaleaceae bacterium]